MHEYWHQALYLLKWPLPQMFLWHFMIDFDMNVDLTAHRHAWAIQCLNFIFSYKL